MGVFPSKILGLERVARFFFITLLFPEQINIAVPHALFIYNGKILTGVFRFSDKESSPASSSCHSHRLIYKSGYGFPCSSSSVRL